MLWEEELVSIPKTQGVQNEKRRNCDATVSSGYSTYLCTVKRRSSATTHIYIYTHICIYMLLFVWRWSMPMDSSASLAHFMRRSQLASEVCPMMPKRNVSACDALPG